MKRDPLQLQQQLGIQRRLASELNAAKEAFEEAKLALDKAAELSSNLGDAHVDGTHALRTAATKYKRATAQYNAAVKRFGDFIVEGKVPSE